MATFNENRGAEPEADGRLPYEKPAIVWQEALQVRPGLLAVCQKLAAAGPDCDAANSES